MIKQKTIVYSLENIDHVIQEISKIREHVSVFTFSGELGSGKTTLIKKLLAHWGVSEVIVSPTFFYVIKYFKNNQNFYHFDLYRLNFLNEFLEAGFADLIYIPNSWSLIEWPEIIMPLLTKKVCHIFIDYKGKDERILTYSYE